MDDRRLHPTHQRQRKERVGNKVDDDTPDDGGNGTDLVVEESKKTDHD